MTSTTGPRPEGAARRGTALPAALLVLVVLTLLGTAAVFTASTEVDVAGNGRRELQALSVSEAGVHEALARLNVDDPAITSRIVPGETSPGVPNPDWSVTIVKGTPGANQVRTVTAGADPTAELPLSTAVRYKREAAESPVSHCNANGCGAEVVRFHEDFAYQGTHVPKGTQVGPAVLQIESTYSQVGQKTLLVEAVRSLSQAKTPGTVRACGAINCSGSNKTSSLADPTKSAIVAGTTSSGCDASKIDPDPGTTTPNSVQTGQTCPADVFYDTFGMSKSDMKGIADINATAPYATPPSGTKGKIIWVSGTTGSTWQGNPVIGTQQEPVIVIFEGDFHIQGTLQFYGVIYVMGNMSFGSGNLSLNGAVIVEKDTSTTGLSGNSTITYDPSVMNNLNKLSPFTTIGWKAK